MRAATVHRSLSFNYYVVKPDKAPAGAWEWPGLCATVLATLPGLGSPAFFDQCEDRLVRHLAAMNIRDVSLKAPIQETMVGQQRFGPILFAPGVKRSQALLYVFIGCTGIVMTNFMGVMQPYVFNSILHVPHGVQGKLAGNLAAFQQIAVLLLVSLFGALSDRIGRRFFLIMSSIGMTLVTALYPFASSILFLYLLRLAYGVASSASTASGPAIIMDLPDNNSRGRFLSLVQMTQAIGIGLFVSLIGAKGPKWLVEHGFDQVTAGRYVFGLIALLGASGAALVVFVFKPPRIPVSPDAPSVSWRTISSGLGAVLRHAKTNPRFRILLILSMVLRADGAVVMSFLSLWIVSSAKDAGVSTVNAMASFGSVMVVWTLLHTALPILAGFVVDKFNRVAMLLTSLVLTVVGFGATALVKDVTGPGLIAVIVIICIADALQIVSALSLLGQETPPEMRGAAYGFYALLGVASMIVIDLVSGYAFDAVGYNAPFLLIALLSAVALAWALITLAPRKPKPPAVLAA